MLAEEQSLGTDLRYSSVCLITPILRDHFRFVGNSYLIALCQSCPSYARSFRQRFLLIRRTLTGGVKAPGCQRRQASVWMVFALLNGILTCLGRR